jgi:hypothetical protein
MDVQKNTAWLLYWGQNKNKNKNIVFIYLNDV